MLNYRLISVSAKTLYVFIREIMLNHLNVTCDMSHVMEKPVCVHMSHG